MGASPADADFEAAQAVADAILYEGYLLYPYRRSADKNRIRWQFGVLVPRAWAEAHGLVDAGVAGSAESWWQQTECLLETAESATVQIRLRYLQLQRKSVEERLVDGAHRPVDRLEVGSRAEVSFDEAVPREFDAAASVADLLAGERRFELWAPGGEDVEPLIDDQGHTAGRVVRRRWPVAARVTVSMTICEAPFRLFRLRVRVENADRALQIESTREEALRGSLVASHTLLRVRGGGSFVSLLDPPHWAQPAVRACSNVHTFPVLVGEPGRRDLVLSSPILLYDHPQIAPESPGDLHDATEIDEILSLRTLTLTDAEKREARATDPRAAAIIDRVDTMPPEVLSRLHGAVRSLRPVVAQDTGGERVSGGERPSVPWWDPGADTSVSPETDSVVVAGTHISKGSRVRLRPRRSGTDAHDMFLDGRIARVEAVLLDVDDSQHLAVTLEDDPGAELNQWYGRFRYFSPDEVEPLIDKKEPG
jgi:hypothetical protein